MRTASAARALARTALAGNRGVIACSLALLGLAATLLPAALSTAPAAGGPALPWWALALAFAAVEVCVVHVQVRREASTVSLSELPLVAALFFASPTALVVGRLVGVVAALVLVRRQTPLKIAFNTALSLASVGVALTVFSLFDVRSLDAGVAAWVAVLLAVAAASSLDAVAIAVVIAVHERRVRWLDLLSEPAGEAVRAVCVGVVALVPAYALAADARAVLPLVVAAGVLLLSYRAYAKLRHRHLSLERLFRFSQAVSSDPGIDGIVQSVMLEARELLHAETAQVAFASPQPGGPAVCLTLGPGDRVVRSEALALLAAGSVPHAVLSSGVPALVARGNRDAGGRRLVELLGVRDAVVAPLRGEAGVIGVLLVGDRLGDVRGFDAADVQLLETVANHASVALQNGRLIDQLRHDALHDALTGLPNRVAFQRATEEALAALDAGEVRGLAVMIMDLDGFKEVNDTLGHHHGDALLVEVAQRLKVAGGNECLVARLGGDEFAVLLRATGQPEDALRRGRRLIASLEQPITLDGLDVEVGGSMGVAWSPEHGSEASVLLKHADLAMYAAKGSSAGVRLYDPSLDTTDPQRLALVGELRSAIELDQLEVHVQPKARLSDGEVTSVEALVRWTHPVHGALPPDEFIPLAERSGLIAPLTHLVLRRALRACQQWQAAGHDVGIAVNLSTRSLVDLDLADDVAALLRRYSVPPTSLTLEITEGTVMSDPTRTMALLLALRELGVRLSVDDFGTGYSSLSYLKRLPVQEVKIDKSFVTHMVDDEDDATIVRSIIDLAANLALEVVAEGVEDQASWDRLRELGCTYVQGWHLGQPMPSDALAAWLDGYRARRSAQAAAALAQLPPQRGPAPLRVVG